MKINIDITDDLLADAQRLATERGVTLSELVEQGLRTVVPSGAGMSPAFKLRRASFKGRGLQPDVQRASWQQLLELAYQRRSDRA
jgi:Arc/MetJ family transcription regulator